MRRLSEKKRFAFDKRFSGTVRPVLFESENKNGFIQGWTDNYVRMAVPYNPALENRIIPVELGKRSKEGLLFGKIGRELLEQETAIASITE